MNITQQDELQNRMLERRRTDVLYCQSCDREVREEQCDRCAICHEPGCKGQDGCLREIETGEYVCEECKEIAIAPLHVAAKRAARTGTHRDLQAYLKLRRETAPWNGSSTLPSRCNPRKPDNDADNRLL